MYFPSVREDLLGRRRRRRLWWVRLWAVVLVAAGLIVWSWWQVRQRDQAELLRAEDTAALQSLEAPRIRLPIGLDEFLEEPTVAAQTPVAGRYPSHVQGEVRQGQTLFAALTERGVPSHTIQPVVNAVGQLFDFRTARVGDRFEAALDDEGTITRFRYQTSPESVYEARLVGPGEYDAILTEIPLESELLSMATTIDGSLYRTITMNGEQSELARRITQIFQWDIDFSRDVRPGDAFRMIYEKLYLDGTFLRYGRILAIEYRGHRVRQTAFWFDEPGLEGYYTWDGEPLRRMFLKAPCQYRRISSGFNLQRVHPVLGVVRPHYGVDYVADTGTPVVAVADGVVDFAAFRGAAGNLVTLEHEHGYRTAYAHLHGFARGIERGARVRQGQVIGYVGNTGRSTGAHLHFGMKLNNRHIDPLAHANRRMPGLQGRDLHEYQRVRDRLRYDLDELIIPEIELDESPLDDVPVGGHDEGSEVYDF